MENRRASQGGKVPVIVRLNFSEPDEEREKHLTLGQFWNAIAFDTKSKLTPASYIQQRHIRVWIERLASGSRRREVQTSLRLAVDRGLPAAAALEALTAVPARLLESNNSLARSNQVNSHIC